MNWSYITKVYITYFFNNWRYKLFYIIKLFNSINTTSKGNYLTLKICIIEKGNLKYLNIHTFTINHYDEKEKIIIQDSIPSQKSNKSKNCHMTISILFRLR